MQKCENGLKIEMQKHENNLDSIIHKDNAKKCENYGRNT